MRQRRHDIDNLRTFCILLLVPYHAAMAFNCWGEANYVWFGESRALSAFVTVVSPWYMAALFLAAGLSARFSLQKRGMTGYVKERIKKLLIPLIAGIFTVVAALTYYADRWHNGYTGNFFSHYQIFITRITDLTGYDGGFTPGHLWFLLYLFLISMLALGVSKLQEKFLKQVHWNTPSVWKVWLFGLLPVIGKPVLDIGGKSIGAYLAFFLIGYYVFYREDVTGFLKKYFPLHLVIFLIADLFNVYLFCYCKDLHAVMNTVCMFAAQWFGILTAVGFFAKFLNFSNERTAFLCKNSFAFYILHFVFLVAAQFYFSRYTSSTVLLFLVPCVVAYLVTFLCCALLSRMKKRGLSGVGKRDGVRK